MDMEGRFIALGILINRSALMVAMIMVVKGIAKDFDDAYITLKLRRKRVNIKSHQRAAAIRILERYSRENSTH